MGVIVAGKMWMAACALTGTVLPMPIRLRYSLPGQTRVPAFRVLAGARWLFEAI